MPSGFNQLPIAEIFVEGKSESSLKLVETPKGIKAMAKSSPE